MNLIRLIRGSGPQPPKTPRTIQAGLPAKSPDPMFELAEYLDRKDRVPVDEADLVDSYTVKVPRKMSCHLAPLTLAQRREMNEVLLVTIALYLHEIGFKPSDYLEE